MSDDWSRVVNTTISNFIRGEEVNILRNRKLTAMLKSKGRLTMNWAGDDMNWKVRFKRAPMTGYADTDTLTFQRRDRWKTARLGWRGYSATDAMTKQERLKNRGVQAIVNVYSQIAQSLMDDMQEGFSDELYIDGNASGNSKKMHGIESFCGAGAAGPLVAVPNDNFAGLDTNLGIYGGAWQGSWPTGIGDANYDFWSPLLVNYTGSGWGATTKTWANTCVEALRFAIIKTMKNKTNKGKLDVFFLNDELYRQFLALLEQKQRIVVQSNASNSTLIKLGFTDVQNFDGVDITYEFGTPIDTGYGINCDQMEVRSMQGQLFVPDGPEYDIASKTWRFAIDFFGNTTWNPRYHCKLKNYS